MENIENTKEEEKEEEKEIYTCDSSGYESSNIDEFFFDVTDNYGDRWDCIEMSEYDRINDQYNEENSDELSERRTHSGTMYIKDNETNKGETIKSLRHFGVELECFTNNADERREIIKELNDDIGIHHDGSIEADYGFEIVTPVANGKSGEKLIQSIIDITKRYDVYVNSSTGYHLHINIPELIESGDYERTKIIKNIMMFYTVFENVLLSFLPRSRHNGEYCKNLQNRLSLYDISKCNDEDQLSQLWYKSTSKDYISSCKREKKDGSRYHTANIHLLFNANRIEIRMHSGTLNYNKIVNWIALHTCIIDRIVNSGISYSFLENSNAILDIKEKSKEFFDWVSDKWGENDKLSSEIIDFYQDRQSYFMQSYFKQLDSNKKQETVDQIESEDEQYML